MRFLAVTAVFAAFLAGSAMGLEPTAAEKKQVKEWAPKLKAADAQTRAAAARALGKIGPGAGATVPALAKLLDDDDKKVRSAAIGALHQIGTAAFPQLLAALKSKHDVVKFTAAVSMRQFGPRAAPAVPTLVALMDESKGMTRAMIVESLCSIGPAAKPAVPAIAKVLGYSGGLYDEILCDHLGRLGPDAAGAIPALIKTMKTGVEAGPQNAAEALGKIGPGAKVAVPALIKTLGSKRVYLRCYATSAFGDIGPEARDAVPALVKVLKGKSVLQRAVTIIALGKIGPAAKSATAELQKLSVDKKEKAALRMHAKVALLKIKGKPKEALAVYAGALESKDLLTRIDAVMAIGQAGPAAKSAVGALIKLFSKKTNIKVGWRIAEALGKIGPNAAPAVPVLAKRMGGWNYKRSEMIFRALVKIGPAAAPALQKLRAARDPDYGRRAARALDLMTWALAATKTVPVRIVTIPGTAPYYDHKSNATIYPDSEVALPLLLKALKDKRVEYRRGAARGLKDFSVPSDAGPAIGPLAEALSDEDAGVRMIAAEALRDLAAHVEEAKEAVPALRKALADRDPRVKAAASAALGAVSSNSDAAGEALAKLADSKDARVRYRSRQALASMKPKYAKLAVELVLRDIESKDAKVRERAASLIDSAEAVHRRVTYMVGAIPALTRHLTTDASPNVRWSCAVSLGALGAAARQALPALRKALKDENPTVRRFALTGFLEVGPEPVDIPMLVSMVKRSGKNQYSRRQVARALGEMGKAGADVLIPILEHPDEQMRRAALSGLYCAGVHARPAVPRLLTMIRGLRKVESEGEGQWKSPGSKERRGIMAVFGRLGSHAPEAVSVLIEHVRGGEKMDAFAAYRALGEMGEVAAPAVPLMIELLKTKYPYERWLGAFCLTGIGPKAKAAVPELKKLLKDKKRNVREAAAEALKRIQVKGPKPK
jgi:HEAT repeat protein